MSNQIVQENKLPGSPDTQWDLSGPGSGNIEGFATDISVNLGETVNFKINTNSTNYRIDIYRLGYYARQWGAPYYNSPAAQQGHEPAGADCR